MSKTVQWSLKTWRDKGILYLFFLNKLCLPPDIFNIGHYALHHNAFGTVLENYYEQLYNLFKDEIKERLSHKISYMSFNSYLKQQQYVDYKLFSIYRLVVGVCYQAAFLDANYLVAILTVRRWNSIWNKYLQWPDTIKIRLNCLSNEITEMNVKICKCIKRPS